MMLRVVVCLLAFLSTVLAVNLSQDVDKVPEEEFECYGTSVGFGFSGTRQFHYHNLRKRYEGCTFVHGNLEITNLDDPNISYDVSFLRHIRHVTGYVLIGLVTEVPVISFPNLQVVRGNKTYAIHGQKYSFIVALTSRTDLTSGLIELNLPQLREISDGKVMLSKNPLLCHLNAMAWSAILRGRKDDVIFGNQASKCEHCTCEGDAAACWGTNTDVCRPAPPPKCHVTCPYRCFALGEEGCCSDKCAVGCTGPLDSDCLVCKDFEMDGRCLSFCPPMSYSSIQQCISYA